MRPGSVSSMREPSMSTTKRPHSWILAFVHSPIRRPRVKSPHPFRDSKHTERTGKGDRTVRASSGRDHGLVIDRQSRQGGVMASRNVQTHRAGHEAFNQRDFDAMTRHYADSITWTDHSQGRTFRTPQEFKDDFLAGWVQASPDIQITDPRYIDAGQTVVCTFTVVGTQDGPLGPLPPPAAVRAAAVRDVALRLERAGRRRGPLLQPGLAAHAAGPDAAAVRRVGREADQGGT